MFEEIYFEYNPWWEEDFKLNNIIERPEIVKHIEDKLKYHSIIFLTGLRRVGKTTLMKIVVQNLIKKGIPPQNIFYISLDDYLLEKKSIIEIVNDYRKIHKLSKDERVYLFFDEIVYKEKFHQQLKNLYDKEDTKIIAASSSSSILRDKKAFLTGRSFLMEILPLDFNEYLRFKGIKIKNKDKKLLESYFHEFLLSGGIPEYVLSKQREYLHNLVDDILYKDIVARYMIKNHKVVKEMFKVLMNNVGNPVSIYKLSNVLKISTETISRYLQYFKETYLIYLVPRYGKLNQQISSPKKIYSGDIGIRNIFTANKNIGRAFENYVYLKLKDFEPFYLIENKTEIDFFLEKGILIEVKYDADLTEKQKKFFNDFKAKHKLIIRNYQDIKKLEKLLSQ